MEDEMLWLLQARGTPGHASSAHYCLLPKALRSRLLMTVLLSGVLVICGTWTRNSLAGTTVEMGQPLSLFVTVVPTALKPLAEITVVAVIKNVSPRPVLFLPRSGAYADSYLTIRTPSGVPLRTIRGRGIPAVPPTRQSDFLTLQPGEEWRVTFSGYLLNTTKRDGGVGEALSGLFLDFGNSAFLLPGPGLYDLTVEYSWPQALMKDFEAHFGLRDIWYGVLESSPIQLDVK